ncbi:MAG: DUF4139 domain-containing protein, partial [Cyanobacteriota bacterium]
RLNYERETSTVEGQQLVVEYFVPGARWTPSYVCRLDSTSNQATIAVRALICQRTGEDWSGVRLELSTAEPMAWCELPELPSLRIGRAQPVVRKSGWRLPPVGAEILFEDFDRQKQGAIVAKSKHSAIADFFSPQVPPMPIIPSMVPISELGGYSFQSMAKAASMAPEVCAEVEEPGIPPKLELTSFSLQDRVAAFKAEKRAATPQKPELESRKQRRRRIDEGSSLDFLSYSFMRMGGADDQDKRGKLTIEQQQEAYLEILKRQEVIVRFNLIEVLQQAVSDAQKCIFANLPPGGINVREVAGSFDYAYSADGRIDVPSDGEFHSVALTSNSTDIDLRYVVVPRTDTNVFRIAQLKNPLQSPLLAGSTDVYVDGEYILSTNITTVPPKGQMELGLGVEQAIKVARNTTYQEVRSSESLVAFNELQHQIKIDIANRLPKEARIEIRERIPTPDENAKVEVQIDRVSPAWEKYDQKERDTPVRGGYYWRVQVPARGQITLSAHYTIKTFVDSEIIGGNRRE